MKYIPTYFFIVSCFFIGSVSAQSNAVDSLKLLLEKHTEEDTLRVNRLIKTAWAMNYSEPKNALKYTQEAIGIAKRLDFQKGLALAHRQEGNLHFAMANYQESMKSHLAGLKISESLGETKISATIQNNLGNIYAEIGEPEKALEYYEYYLAYAEEADRKDDQVNGLTNIGAIHIDINQAKKGIIYLEKALAIAEEIGNNYFKAAINLNLGLGHKTNKSYSEALSYYSRAQSIAHENGMQHIEALALSNTASINIELKDYEAAEANSKLGLTLAEKSNALDWETQSWEKLSIIYEKTGKYEEAFFAFQNYVALRDSMLTEDKKSELTRIEMEYEMEKQEAVAAEEIKRQAQLKKMALGGIVLLLLGSGFAYYTYKKRRDTLELKQVAEFKSKVADTELMALRSQINPHFIFNSLNSISDCLEKQDVETANTQLVRFSDLTRSILENSKKKWTELGDDVKMMRDYIELELLRLKGKFEYTFAIDEDLDLENVIIPSLIAQPFIENSIWHGLSKKEGKGNLKISISRRNDKLEYVVEDDGIGRKKSEENQRDRKAMGVAITKSRLEIINAIDEVDASLEFVDLTPGLRVVILLPFKEQF